MSSVSGQKKQLLGLALIAASFFVYLPAIRSGFVWDDDVILWNNALIHSPGGLFSFWFTTMPPDYFPLSSSLLWIEWRLFGLDHLWGYHAVNVLLHTSSALLLWRLLEQLRIPGAWIAALIFAVHPVNVESAAWIAQHKSTLSLPLALFSALVFFNSRDKETGKSGRSPFRSRSYWISLGFFLLALLAKTSVVTLPAVLLVLTWWRFGALTRRDLTRTLPFFGVAAILSFVTIWFQYNVSIGDDVVREDGFFSRLAISGWAVWFYLSKAVLPFNLSFMYPRWEANPANPAVYLPLILVISSLVALWRFRSRPWARASFAALLIFVLLLLPVLGFFDIYFMRYSLVADHWQYPAIPAAIALLAAFATTLAARWKDPVPARAIAALVVVVLAILTWQQAAEYYDEETLWRATLAENPKAWAGHERLGIVLAEKNRLREAVPHYRLTLEHGPDRAEARSRLGAALTEPQERDEAEIQYRRAIELDPDYADPWFNLGNLFSNQGDIETAVVHFRKAIDLNPDFALAHANLGNSLALQGRPEEALAHHRRALEIRPGLVTVRLNMGTALLQLGKSAEAAAQFESVLQAQPDELMALTRLAWTLATATDPSVRDGARALELATRATRLTRGHPEVFRTLAAAFAETGRMEDAVKVARRASELASSLRNEPLAGQINAELKLYLQGSPARSGPGGASGPPPGLPPGK